MDARGDHALACTRTVVVQGVAAVRPQGLRVVRGIVQQQCHARRHIRPTSAVVAAWVLAIGYTCLGDFVSVRVRQAPRPDRVGCVRLPLASPVLVTCYQGS